MKAQIKDSYIMPSARKDGLVVKKINSETLIYDIERQMGHCLNDNAALIWENCDGSRTVSELSALLQIEQELVRIALDQLERCNLLQSEPAKQPGITGMSRRQLIKTAGIAALVAIPVVSTIMAPTAAQASTCLASGQGCSISAQCCSGLCSVGSCA